MSAHLHASVLSKTKRSKKPRSKTENLTPRPKTGKYQAASSGVKAPAVSALERSLAANQELMLKCKTLANPNSREMVCSYPCVADRSVRLAVTKEICRQVQQASANGGLTALRLYHNYDAGWESSGSQGILRLKHVAKCAGAIKRASPRSISIISFAPAPISGHPGWNYTVLVSTLELCFGEQDVDNLPPLRRVSRTSTAAYGQRPEFPPETVVRPSGGEVERLIDRFMGMAGELRTACAGLAREENDQRWREQSEARALGLFSAQVLTPLKSAMFAAGDGSTILKVALTEPIAHASAAKKAGALTREQMANLLWQHSLTHGKAAPPFVEV